MANLNLGQDVANKRERNRQLLIIWPNLAVKMCRYGSLINIYPSGTHLNHSPENVEKFFVFSLPQSWETNRKVCCSSLHDALA